MRPFDDMAGFDPDYGDVALLVASVREWPAEDFARELDARVARRFAPEAEAHGHGNGRRGGRSAISRWAAGPAVALVAGAVAAVVVLSGGGANQVVNGQGELAGAGLATHGAATREKPVVHGVQNSATPALTLPSTKRLSPYAAATGSSGTSYGAANTTATFLNAPSASSAPVAPGNKQIQAAQISLTTPNEHVDQVAQEVFAVVGAVHGSVLSSHITSATSNSGGGYASFALSIPTGNLQDAMTQLSRLHYAAVSSRTDASQNVSGQYNNVQRRLADARALRGSLLKQLQTAYTQQAIDSIKAQLKLAERQINTWQAALNSLNHRITFSNVTVQINAGGLPVIPVAHHNNSFTIGRAAHDALHVLVVSAGVALIALAVAVPVGLVVALLMWLWVWLRQRRREHALDATA